MEGETTVSVAGEPLASGHDEAGGVPALVIAWSAEEPARVGEVAFPGALGEALVLGRGDGGEKDRVHFVRQRPGEVALTPPLESRAISRRQLVLRRFAAGIEVERVGRCAMAVNGAVVDRAALTPGDCLLLRGQMLLLCVTRPRIFPACEYFPAKSVGPFGEPDHLGMLGESPAMWALRDRIACAAKDSGHVLLRGESGTGKELAARAIHALSARAGKPFVARNAATLPAGLVDAELFGNLKNYPNPGMPERPGLVGQAHRGVLFLDEIGELPQDLHAHLLRVLDDDGEYQRLGEASPRRSDVRIVGATNRPIGALKHDLAARLRVRVALSPLRDRREDIPLLVRHVVLRAAERSPEVAGRFVSGGARREVRVTAGLIELLLRGSFRTNVRELDAILWQAMSESRGDTLDLRELPEEEAGGDDAAPRPARPGARKEKAPPVREPTADDIRASLAGADNNVRRAAEALGLPSRYALYRLLRKHGIEPKE